MLRKGRDPRTQYPGNNENIRQGQIRRYLVKSKNAQRESEYDKNLIRKVRRKMANISYDTALRGEQLEEEQQEKESQKFAKLLDLHEKNVQKGLNILSKK